jgi:hypothetical protein
MAKIKSFSEAILQEPERFLSYVFKGGRAIKNFEDFDKAFRAEFDTPLGRNTKLDSDDMIVLFETPECKKLMKDQVNEEEYEQLYGDGIVVEREAISKRKIITIRNPKIEKKSYVNPRTNRPVKAYVSGKPRRFNNLQTKFLQTRKQKGLTRSQIFKEYEQSFPSEPRTKSSINSKLYRV